MRKKYWVNIFLFVLIVNLAGGSIANSAMQNISKPLLMPLLIGWFLYSGIRNVTKRNWIILALFFSWLGDVLLMFQVKNELFFILGLSAFLLAHIFYILFFHFIRLKEKIPFNSIFLLVVIVYYVILMSWLSPYLGALTLPVRVYGIVISLMGMMAGIVIMLTYGAAQYFIAKGAIEYLRGRNN